MREAVAVGLRSHSGWAVMVTVGVRGGTVRLLGKDRLDLLGPDLPRQPYHEVAEQGAPRELIGRVEQEAGRRATEALRTVVGLTAVAVVAADRQLPVDLDRILASHPRLHAAEGALYEQAILAAAGDIGVRAHVVPPATAVPPPDLDRLGKAAGPPWQKDHKMAAAAALAALRAAAVSG